MSTLPDPRPYPQDRAIEIVAEGLRVLTTRDGIPLSDEQIAERSRNIVAAILGDFDLVHRPPGLDGLEAALAALRETNLEFRTACADVGELLAVTR